MKNKNNIRQEMSRTILPMIVVKGFRAASFFTGNVMLSRTSDENAAACALIFSINFITEAFYTGGLGVIGSLIGRKIGKNQLERCGKILRNGQILGLCYVVPAAAFALNVKNIFQLPLISQPEEVIKITDSYLKIFVCAFPAIAAYTADEQFGVAVENPQPVIIVKCVSYGALFSSAYFLVPTMGAPGLAISYVIQSWTNLLALEAWQYRSCYNSYEIFNPKNIAPTFKHLHKMVKIGFPSALNKFAELASVFANTILVGKFGKTALAEWNVPTQYLCIFVVFLASLSQSATIAVSKALGFDNPKAARAFGYLTGALGTTLAVGFLLFFILFPNILIEPFFDTKDPKNKEIVENIKILLAVIAGTNIADTIRNIAIGALAGIYDTLFSMISSIGSLWCIGFPLSLTLSFKMSNKTLAVALGQGIGILSGAVLNSIRWIYQSCDLTRLSKNVHSFFYRAEAQEPSPAIEEDRADEHTALIINGDSSTTQRAKSRSRYSGCNIM